MINNIQKRGTTFPVSIQNKQIHIDSNTLMDTGATRSCMNYSTAYKMGKRLYKAIQNNAGGSGLTAVT